MKIQYFFSIRNIFRVVLAFITVYIFVNISINIYINIVNAPINMPPPTGGSGINEPPINLSPPHIHPPKDYPEDQGFDKINTGEEARTVTKDHVTR